MENPKKDITTYVCIDDMCRFRLCELCFKYYGIKKSEKINNIIASDTRRMPNKLFKMTYDDTNSYKGNQYDYYDPFSIYLKELSFEVTKY